VAARFRSRNIKLVLLALTILAFSLPQGCTHTEPPVIPGSATLSGPSAVIGIRQEDTRIQVAGVSAQVPDPEVAWFEDSLLQLVNEDRQSNGVGTVELDPMLLGIARERAWQQINDQPLSHYDTAGQLVFRDILERDGVDYARAGENLARTNGPNAPSPSGVEQALMASPTHRAVILQSGFDRVAVGVVTDQMGMVAVAQIFVASR
jgi:uncharacterized protein YkwD